MDWKQRKDRVSLFQVTIGFLCEMAEWRCPEPEPSDPIVGQPTSELI